MELRLAKEKNIATFHYVNNVSSVSRNDFFCVYQTLLMRNAGILY